MRQLRIRHWEAGDKQSVTDLLHRMHAESRYAFLPFEEARVSEWFDLYVQDRARRCAFAAIEDGEPIGLLAGYLTDYFFCRETVACDQLVYVTAARRGTWAAPRMIHAFRRWAAARGAREVIFGITTGVRPERTGRLYERKGFRFVGGNYHELLPPGKRVAGASG